VSIIAWIVLGLIVGVIAKKLLGGREKHGLVVTILVGVAGALLGGWVASTLLHIDAIQGFFTISTWITAIIGSVVLLLVHHALTNNSRNTLLRRPSRWRLRR
jgi:uncharacterized membrane protein YeaQ/YmgE (transglycosylase-associated protein family)